MTTTPLQLSLARFMRPSVIAVFAIVLFVFAALDVPVAFAQCSYSEGSTTYTCHGTYVATGGGGTCYGYITQEQQTLYEQCDQTSGGGGGGGGGGNSDPIGNLDSATCNASGVTGWAYDAEAPNSPIDVHFYIGSSLVGVVSANQYRGDLGAYGNAQHAYSWSLPESYKNGNAYTLTAYAINTPTGNNPVLNSRSFQCPPPIPPTPTGLYATCNAAGTAVSFGWNASSGATYYAPRIYPTAQGECSGYGWQLWGGDGQTCLAPGDQHYSTNISNFPVIPGKAYSMWVHAVNAGGSSNSSSVGFTCNAPPQPPPQPTGLSATCNAAGTQVTMSWNASAGATLYYYRNSSSDSTCAPGFQGNPSSNCYQNPDGVYGTSVTYPTTPGRTYNWWVHAANNAGLSGASYGAITCPGQPSLTGLVGSAENAIVNQSKTLYGAVRNDGTGAAGAFSNVMQVCNASCASYNQTIAASSVSSLAVGAQQNISATFTPTVTGQLYYRTCADRSTSLPNDGAYAGCSGWQTLSVAPAIPPQPTGLSATCNAAGTQVTMSWTASPGATFYYYRNSSSDSSCAPGWNGNPSSCYPNPDSVTGTSVTYPTTPGRTYDWWVHAANGTGYSSASYGAVTCAGQTDLTAATGAAASTILNQAVTLSGTVSNIGTAAAGYFPNIIQVCNGAGTACDAVATNAVGSLAAGASTAVSGSYTPTTLDRALYRICTNFNTSYVQVHTESNYGNNCGAWQNFTVSAVPTAAISLSPASVAYGGSTTVSWSSTAATSCTGTNFSTGNATSGSVSVSATTNTTYRVDCSGPGGSAWAAATLTVGAQPFPDLTVGAYPTVYGTFGQAITVTGTASNIGNASTGAAFNNMFVTNMNAQQTDWNTIRDGSSSAALAAGGSTSFTTTFPANTFAAPGSYYYAYCTDINSSWVGTITESNENNNCSGWGTIVVQAPDLTAATGAAASAILNQAVTLSGTVSNIGNAAAGYFPNIIQVCNGAATACDVVATNALGSLAAGASAAVSASYTPTSLDRALYRTCANFNTSYVQVHTESNYGNNCGAWQNFTVNAVPTATLTVSPASVAYGGSTTISWSSTAATSCTGTNFSTSNATSGSVVASALTQSTTYTLSCTGPGGNASDTKTVSVSAQTFPDLTTGSVTPTTATAGTAATYTATVSNIGNAMAGATQTRFQSATSAGGADAATVGDAATAGGFDATATREVSVSHTFSSAGTFYLRACADVGGAVTESNEGNNCGVWTAVTVAPAIPPQPTGLSATCNAAGTQVTMSWTASPGATHYYYRNISADSTCAPGFQGNPSTACYPNPDSVSGTSVSYPTTPGRTYDWWVHAANSTGYSTESYGAITCSGQADLTAAPGPTSSATTGQSVTLLGTVSNGGNAAAGYFPNFIQVCDAGTTCGVVNTDSSRTATAVNSLAAGASTGVSATYTPTAAGSLIYRVCTNLNSSWVNVHTESNYGNNCSTWQTLSVVDPIPPSLSCNVSSTTIQAGQSVTYTTTLANGATGPYTWASSDGASLGNSSPLTRTLTVPGIYSMTVRGANTPVAANCPNVTVQATWCTNASTDLSITATPNRVRAGRTVSLAWSASGVNGEGAQCTVTGPGVSWSSAVSVFPSCSASGGPVTATIDTQSVYTLTCGDQTTSVIVNVIPNFEEF